MPPGKPFTKITDAQRAAANAQLKKDVFGFIESIIEPAARAAGKHLDDNPQSIVTQIAKEPFVHATLVTVAREAHKLRDEQQAKVGADLDAAAAKASEEASVNASANAGPKVVDAEFVDDAKPAEPKI